MFQEDVHQDFPSLLPSSVRQQEIRVTWNVADPLHCYKALHLLQQRLRSSHRPASFLVTEYTCLCYFSKQQLYFELNYKCKFSAVVSHRLDTVYPVIYSRTLLHNLSSSSGHAGSNYSKAPWALQSSTPVLLETLQSVQLGHKVSRSLVWLLFRNMQAPSGKI